MLANADDVDLLMAIFEKASHHRDAITSHCEVQRCVFAQIGAKQVRAVCD